MDGLNEYVYLLILSVVSVVILFIISKLLGKKQISQLTFIDYVIGISIGSIAAEMATDTSQKPIWFYIIAMTIFFLFDILLTLVGRTLPALKRFVNGKPLTIIYDGKIDYDMLRKSKLGVNEVMSLCREQGYFDISKVAYAVFENSGKLSVLPVAEETPTVAKDLNIVPEKPSLPYYTVIDGRISYSTLNELDKTEEWLYDKLGISSDEQLKDIILAVWDDKDMQMNVMNKADSPSKAKHSKA